MDDDDTRSTIHLYLRADDNSQEDRKPMVLSLGTDNSIELSSDEDVVVSPMRVRDRRTEATDSDTARSFRHRRLVIKVKDAETQTDVEEKSTADVATNVDCVKADVAVNTDTVTTAGVSVMVDVDELASNNVLDEEMEVDEPDDSTVVETNKEIYFQCETCSCYYKSLMSLQKHSLAQHNKTVSADHKKVSYDMKCKFCNSAYVFETYNLHIRNKHIDIFNKGSADNLLTRPCEQCKCTNKMLFNKSSAIKDVLTSPCEQRCICTISNQDKLLNKSSANNDVLTSPCEQRCCTISNQDKVLLNKSSANNDVLTSPCERCICSVSNEPKILLNKSSAKYVLKSPCKQCKSTISNQTNIHDNIPEKFVTWNILNSEVISPCSSKAVEIKKPRCPSYKKPIPKNVLFQCPKCHLNFFNYVNGLNHTKACQKGVQKNLRIENCKKCDNKFYSAHIKRHYQQHEMSNEFKIQYIVAGIEHNIVYRCMKCKVCTDDKGCKLHFKYGCKSEGIPCTICNVKIDRDYMLRHKAAHNKGLTKGTILLVDVCD